MINEQNCSWEREAKEASSETAGEREISEICQEKVGMIRVAISAIVTILN